MDHRSENATNGNESGRGAELAPIRTALVVFLVVGAVVLIPFMVFNAVMDRATNFAPGYSERVFQRQIRAGMTEAEVKRLLGPPLDKSDLYDGYWWNYATPRDTSEDAWGRTRRVELDGTTHRVRRTESFHVLYDAAFSDWPNPVP